MKFLDVDQKSFLASLASGSESWSGGGKDPSDSNLRDFLLQWDDAVPRWMFSVPDVFQKV